MKLPEILRTSIFLIALILIVCGIEDASARPKEVEGPSVRFIRLEETSVYPEKPAGTSARPKKSEGTSVPPAKHEGTFPALHKKSEGTSARPERPEGTSVLPKRSGETSARPEKPEGTSVLPKKLEGTSAHPEKTDEVSLRSKDSEESAMNSTESSITENLEITTFFYEYMDFEEFWRELNDSLTEEPYPEEANEDGSPIEIPLPPPPPTLPTGELQPVRPYSIVVSPCFEGASRDSSGKCRTKLNGDDSDSDDAEE